MKRILLLSLLIIGCNSIDNKKTIIPIEYFFEESIFLYPYAEENEEDYILYGDINQIIYLGASFSEKFGRKIYSYDYDYFTTYKFKNGNLIESYNSDNNFYLEYDDNGNLILSKIDNFYGSQGVAYRFYESERYTYDDNGNQISTEWYGDDGIIESERYTYDDNGNQISTEWYYEYTEKELWAKSISEYDDNGNEILSKWYDEDDVETGNKYIYEYDDNGNQISTENYQDEELYSKYISEYDDNGNLILSKRYNKDGELTSKYIYEYDDNGNLILAESYDDDDINKSVFENKYDKKGNHIQVHSYNNELKSEGFMEEIIIIYN